jgi:hypothetical protein
MIGEVTEQAKYAHNAAMVAIVLLAVGAALLRRPTPSPEGQIPDLGDESIQRSAASRSGGL